MRHGAGRSQRGLRPQPTVESLSWAPSKGLPRAASKGPKGLARIFVRIKTSSFVGKRWRGRSPGREPASPWSPALLTSSRRWRSRLEGTCSRRPTSPDRTGAGRGC